MNNQYLTTSRKEWYMNDFRNLLKINKEFWRIDNDELKNILSNINANEHIQTLYSKFINLKDLSDNSSYLVFGFSSEVELILFRNTIPFFIDNYNVDSSNCQSICTYEFFMPKENENYFENSAELGMKCTDDKNYFKLNHIRLNLQSGNRKSHTAFWNDLNSKLTDLKPLLRI